EVACHLQLVAAADSYPLDPRDGRLPDLAQTIVHVLERAEPFPIFARVADELRAPRLEVRADAEGAARAPDYAGTHRIVPARVLARPRDLAEHAEVERVQNFGPVEGDRRPRRLLRVDDPLEAELVGRKRPRRVRLRHARTRTVRTLEPSSPFRRPTGA